MQKASKQTGGAAFDPDEQNVFFLASTPSFIHKSEVKYPYCLFALNDLKSDAELQMLDTFIAEGVKVLIDSGIFWLTNQHKRKYNISMDQALALPPDQIDGFDQLFERYCRVIGEYGDRVWGYIELDQGGMENKIKTRSKLESMGMRPMPVYHPLNDGYEYFDWLASEYDRICVGNLVQADPVTRRAVISTIWQRRQNYPNLKWIHFLGYTPNQWLYAYPTESCDSSTWLSAVRWGQTPVRTALKPLSKLPATLKVDKGNPIHHIKGVQSGAYYTYMDLLNWRQYLASTDQLNERGPEND